MKRCTAITRKKTRCKRRGKVEFAGLCQTHFFQVEKSQKSLEKPPNARWEKVRKNAGRVATGAGALAAAIKILEFIIQHWPNMYITFPPLGLPFNKVAAEELIHHYMHNPIDSDYESLFAYYFISLPKEVKEELYAHFGKEQARSVVSNFSKIGIL